MIAPADAYIAATLEMQHKQQHHADLTTEWWLGIIMHDLQHVREIIAIGLLFH